MRKLTKEQVAAVHKLTVGYQAYFAAVHEGDLNGVTVWGRILLEAQATTGIEMLDPDSLNFKIGYATRRLKALERLDAEEAAAVKASALPPYNLLVGKEDTS